jgi:hypothetical protein
MAAESERDRMKMTMEGLSQKQQNDCRAALAKFIVKHQLADWEMTIEAQETLPMGYSVKVGITPSAKSGLPRLPIDEFAEVNTSADAAAAVERLLETAYLAIPAA